MQGIKLEEVVVVVVVLFQRGLPCWIRPIGRQHHLRYLDRRQPTHW